jgi:hypothetical protein
MATDNGLTYTASGGWEGNFDSDREEGGRRPAGVTSDAAEGYTWRRTVLILTRQRQVQGVTAYTSPIGTQVAGNTLTITNGSTTLQAGAGDQYINDDDGLRPSIVLGDYVQYQVWRSPKDWEEVLVEPVP